MTCSLSYRLASISLSITASLIAGLLLLSPVASARDLHGRVGLGYNAQFANSTATNGVPAIALKYAATRDIALEGIVGIATTTPGNSVFGVKFFKNLFMETNLNFYFALGGGVLSANNRSGAEFIGAFGAEFFIPGIESLGWSMETGGSFGNLADGSFALRTLGFSFLNAGMRFYF